MIKRIFFTAIAAFALSIAAQAADMDSGTWVLNVAKSTNNGLARSQTHVISMEGGWRINRRHGVDKNGNPTRYNSITKFDGVARPSIGYDSGVGMLSTGTKSDDFHRKTVGIAITGKARVTQVNVISPDGKVRTRTTTGVDKDGKTSNSVSVYDKQ